MSVFNLSSQLLLPVRENSDASFDTFYCEKNAKAKFLLARCIDRQIETAVFVTGPEGVGKTHLMNSALAYAENKVSSKTCYFSLAELNGYQLAESDVESLFASFEGYSIMALDHLDSWLQDSALSSSFKERCLFNLFNHYKMNAAMLLMASSLSVGALKISLPDLLSRLKSSLLISLSAYDDFEKEIIMQNVAIRKGFSLEEEVSAYILKRSGRCMADLMKALDKLDRASLTEQRKLTIPFVKKVLNW